MTTHSRQESVFSLLEKSASQFLLFRDSGILSHDFHGFLLKNWKFCVALFLHNSFQIKEGEGEKTI